MNKELWNNILQFDLEGPMNEYGFSIRLAHENGWTEEFTKQAILEYKKFMYLAATSKSMVSPSEVVDMVWHQHLLFTKSYHAFCELLGKNIQHIPSTHDPKEFVHFQKAKENTRNLYNRAFGEQPSTIWEVHTMQDGLGLKKARMISSSWVIFTMLLLAYPLFGLLRPLYVTIDNPDFLIGYGGIFLATTFVLMIINRVTFSNIFKGMNKDSFIHKLNPLELIYLKKNKSTAVVDSVVNGLVKDGSIIIHSDFRLQASLTPKVETPEQQAVMNSLQSLGTVHYPSLMATLLEKPIFQNSQNAMQAFLDKVKESTPVVALKQINVAIFTLLLMLGGIRMVLGVMRDRPVGFLILALVVGCFIMMTTVVGLNTLIGRATLSTYYKRHILPKMDIANDWLWSYFLMDSAVLATNFVPVVKYTSGNKGSTCGTSCGGGSGCGGGCGGCGGCGG